MEPMSEMERGQTDLSSFAMLLLKSNGGVDGAVADAGAGEMMMDDDDDESCSSDVVSAASSSAPSRTLRNFFRKRHKSVTVGPECSSRRSSGDWKETSPSTSAPGAKIRSLLPGIARPRSRSDLTVATQAGCGGGGRPISVQPRTRRCSYSVQSETDATSDFFVEPESEGRRSRGSGDSGLPASLQNVYRTPVHGSSSSTAMTTPASLSSISSARRIRWGRSDSVRETPSIGPSEFVELYRSRAYSDPRTQDRNAALAARRRWLSRRPECPSVSPRSSWSGVGEFEPRQMIIWKDQQSGTQVFRLPSTHEEDILDFTSFDKFDDLVFLRFLKSHTCYDVLPTSNKVVVLDTQLNVKKAFFALVDNGVRAAPLWDTNIQNIVGMFTVTDFIKILLKYHSASQFAMEDIEGHTIAEWSELLADIGPRPLLSISPDTTMLEAIRKLCLYHVHRLPVVDVQSGNLLYLLTHKRLLNYLYNFFQQYGLRHPPFMDKSLDELGIGSFGRIATVEKDTCLSVVLDLFMSRRVSSLPVVDNCRRFINVVAKADVMVLASQKSYMNLNSTLEQVLGDHVSNGKNPAKTTVLTCLQTESLSTVVERIVTNGLNRLVVVDNDGCVEGIVSLSDILRRLVLSTADGSQTENSDVSTFCEVLDV